jgi:hypothetical protein
MPKISAVPIDPTKQMIIIKSSMITITLLYPSKSKQRQKIGHLGGKASNRRGEEDERLI